MLCFVLSKTGEDVVVFVISHPGFGEELITVLSDGLLFSRLSLIVMTLSYVKLLSLLMFRTGWFEMMCCRFGEIGLLCVLDELELRDFLF